MSAMTYESIQPKKKNENENSLEIQAKSLTSLYRSRVIEAYRNHCIFTVFGNYGTIRKALLKRGWLEKLPPSRFSKLQNLSEDVLLRHAKQGNEYETVIISKLMANLPAFFVWQAKGQRDLYVDVKPYRNRIRRSQILDFSTKVGLIGCAEQELWHRQEGVAGMLYPRFYRMGCNQEEQTEFIHDFRLTQCRSLLRYLIDNKNSPENIIDFENGSISPAIVNFAIVQVKKQSEDCEMLLESEPEPVSDIEWNDFVLCSRKVLNLSERIKCTYRELIDYMKTANAILAKTEDEHPDYKWDGYKNLWILKPGYQSRGLGIVIRNTLEDILRWSTSHSSRSYIVQKYIEQPLLIYNTKFDIRQYMLVYVRESTIQIWLYRDCYLRFSSQKYNIDDLRESIHLTNNSVQKKYKNETSRDPRLPQMNMWSLDQFKTFMKTQNISDDLWKTKVFAGFRQNLIAVVLASLDETQICENCFELYGCDFMLDNQYNPILIEINSTPDLSASTQITARICPMVMMDCIKVVVDRSRNNKASTGLFEMAFEVNYRFKEDYDLKEGLNVSGKAMKLCTRCSSTPFKSIFLKRNKKNDEKKKQSRRLLEKSKTQPPSVPYRKSKTMLVKNTGQILNSAAKEALALRYTMPK